AHVPLGNADYQTEVALSQTTLSFLGILNVTTMGVGFELFSFAALHTLGQTYLFLSGQEWHSANLAQVHPYRVIQAALEVCYDNAHSMPAGICQGVIYIFRSRLPIGWLLFCRIQSIHRLIVL